MEEKEKLRLQSHFLTLLKFALCDNHFSSKEIRLLYELGLGYGFSEKDIDYIIDNPSKIEFIIPEGFFGKLEELYNIIKMMLIDDKIDDFEKKLFNEYCISIGIKKNKILELYEFLLDGIKNSINKNDLFLQSEQLYNN